MKLMNTNKNLQLKKAHCVLSIISIILCLCPFVANAEVLLPPIFSSNMVLQQNTTVNFWGTADKNESFTIAVDWQKDKILVTAGKDGKWRASVKTTEAGGPYEIKITGTNTVIFRNVMLGEVWFCSGQSNMEYSLAKIGGWKKNKDDLNDLLQNDYISIRLCQIERSISDTTMDDCNAHWMLPDSTTVKNFSATAWFYGLELYKTLHVPIALISSNWGGTPAEAWAEYSALAGDKALSYYLDKDYVEYGKQNKRSILYNAMVYPLHLFPIKGAIWYQGEANIYDADLYHRLFSTMVKTWRNTWNIGDFPFYYTQIAPYDYKSKCNASAYLREAQLQSLDIPNSGMAVTLDIGEKNDIHPHDKKDVGKRLALLALAHTYHKIEVSKCTGPTFESMTVDGPQLRLSFSNANGGLVTKDSLMRGFEMAGTDKVFYTAKALIKGSEVWLQSDKVTKPIAARYAFSDTTKGCLFNKEGLPASSFRTDTEPFFYRQIHFHAVRDSLDGKLYAVLSVNDKNAMVRYTLDGSVPDINSKIYTDKILLTKSVQINARSFNGKTPCVNTSTYNLEVNKAWNKTLRYLTTPQGQFKGNDYILVDGFKGSSSFRDGFWQGFFGDDAIVIIDFDTPTDIYKVKTEFVQDIQSGIFMPEYVDVYVSKNKLDYELIRTDLIKPDNAMKDAYIKGISIEMQSKGVKSIKIVAKNVGLCPVFIPNYKAWLYIDEIEVE